MNRPRIALLSSEDTRSRSTWSGIPFYMGQALQTHCGDVIHLGPVFSAREFAGRVRNKLSRTLLGRRHAYHHTPALAREYARTFRQRLRAAGPVDLIFAPAASTQIAMLETEIPIVYTSDTTFQLMCDYYLGFSGLGEAYSARANDIERRALQKAAAVIYPSQWAARSAQGFYQVEPERVRVIPYGADLDRVPAREAIPLARSTEGCSLLFLGREWDRKGGPIAYQTVEILRQGGLDATLTVCGCTPPEQYRAEWLRIVPSLDKNDPTQQQELSRLLLEAHFLLLPTRSECYGIVFCEASAHGTPSITTDTGGVSGAVEHNRSGFLLPPEAGAEAYAAGIGSLLRNPERYCRLVASSHEHYEERVNWDRWGIRVSEIITSLLR